jgi:hypothetical protein
LLVSFFTAVPLVHGDPILAQNPFSNVNTTASIPPSCGGNPEGTLCPSSNAQTLGTCFQPTLTGTIGSASLMLKLNAQPVAFPRQGQPVISGRIFIVSADPSTPYAQCRPNNPFSSSTVILAQSDFLSFCYSGGGCFCNTCVGLNAGSFNVVTWAFTGGNQVIIAAGQTYVLLLWLECDNAVACVYDDVNALAQGVNGNSLSYGGGAVGCRACMVVDPWNSGPFFRSTYDSSIVIGQAESVPFVLFATTGGTVTPGGTQCNGGNCGSVTTTSSTTSVPFNSSVTLFYIGSAPFDGFIINVTTFIGSSVYFGTLTLGVYIVNNGCVTANGPFSVQCPGILLASKSYLNPTGPAKIVFVTSVQVVSGQSFGVALSGSVTGLRINDTNTASVMYQTSGTMPTVINQYQTFSGTSHVALYAGLFKGSSPPSAGTPGSNTVGDLLLGFVDWLGMGRLAGGLTALIVIFTIITVGISIATRELVTSPGGKRKGGFPPVGFLLLFLFLVFIFSAPIASGGVSILPAWVTIFVMAVFTWMFTEGILRKGGRF